MPARLDQRGERAAEKPVRVAGRVAHIGNRHRRGDHDAVVAPRLMRFLALAQAGLEGAQVDRAGRADGRRRERLDGAALQLLRRRDRDRRRRRRCARAPCDRRAARRRRARCASANARASRGGSRGTIRANTSSPRDLVRHRRDRDARDAVEVRQHAFDLDHRDVLARAAHDVLLAVDEEQRAVVALAHDVAGVKPAAGPGLGGRGFVLQVFGEEAAPRRRRPSGAPAVRRPRRAAHPRLRHRRCDSPSSAHRMRPMQRLPTWRGPPAVVVTAPAPVSVIAQASISGKPKRALEHLLMARIDAGAEAEAHAVRRLGVFLVRAAAGSPASRRDSGSRSRRSPSRCATSAARGSGRAARPCRPSGSCRSTVQPSAFMWNSGSGVSTISLLAHRGLAALR